MGEAEPYSEVLLTVLPFPEPTALLNDIRKKFPHIRVEYCRVMQHEDIVSKSDVVPKGLYRLGGFTLLFYQKIFPIFSLPHYQLLIPNSQFAGSVDILAVTTILSTLQFLPRIEDAPRLKLVHSITAGVDHLIDDPIITQTNIPITTVSGIHGPPISEWVIMNWLVSSRLYDMTSEWQRAKVWTSNKGLIHMMQDHVKKRVGILGYGSIGRQVARVSVAMGMEVLAYTFSPRLTPESKQDKGYIVPGTGDPDGSLPIEWHSGKDKASLHHFLAQNLDYLLISVPLTQDTNKFLGAEEFCILSKNCVDKKRRPFVTNISRGRILDQDALLASLQSGELGGAAVDVTEPEPLPADHPLWTAPNIHISPHMSSLGVEYLARSFDVLGANLTRMERGEPLINEYRREKGY
ncbi:hypothetical protein FQN57_003487 [Myotisia sp. PD_48]|nr:hypothetical protein FQN57_003487 [Myotisia sp. PD_48]